MHKLIFLLFSIYSSSLFSQQIADTSYKPIIHNPAYDFGKGSIIKIDEAHSNFHTKTGRYLPFAQLLERDGYVVKEFKKEFTASSLSQCKILVISNAINPQNREQWANPTLSAFSKSEIQHVFNWVKNGGSLFLIADHMPFAGAAESLAAVFDIEFQNGFAFNETSENTDLFQFNDSTLVSSTITNGRFDSEKVKSVRSFTGQAFPCPETYTPIAKMSKGSYQLYPDTAWRFHEDTKLVKTDSWCQIAYTKFGQGKIVVSGEAAMFSAQLAGPNQIKSGMNSENAKENFQLLLNIIHWLDGLIN